MPAQKINLNDKSWAICPDNDPLTIVSVTEEQPKLIDESNVIPYNGLITSAQNKGAEGYALTSGGSIKLNEEKSRPGVGGWTIQPSGLNYETRFEWLLTEEHDTSATVAGQTQYSTKVGDTVYSLIRSGGKDIGDDTLIESTWILTSDKGLLLELGQESFTWMFCSNVGEDTFPVLVENSVGEIETEFRLYDMREITDSGLPEPFLNYTVYTTAVGELLNGTMFKTGETTWLAVAFNDIDCDKSGTLIWRLIDEEWNFIRHVKYFGCVSPQGFITGEPIPDLSLFKPSSLKRLENGQYQLDLWDGGDSQISWNLLNGYLLTEDGIEEQIVTRSNVPEQMIRINTNVNDTQQPEFPEAAITRYYYFNFVEDRKVYYDYGIGWQKFYLRNATIPDSGTVIAMGWGNDIYLGITDGGILVTSTDATIWNRESVNFEGQIATRIYNFGGQWIIPTTSGNIMVSSNKPSFYQINNVGTTNIESVGATQVVGSTPSGNLGSQSALTVANKETDNLLIRYDDFDLNYISQTDVETINDVCTDGEIIITVGDEGEIWRTTNLSEWNKQNSRTERNLNSICYGAGKFVVVGDNGTILNSSNGENWQVIINSAAGNIKQVFYTLKNTALTTGWFIYRTEDGRLFRSDSGNVWTGIAANNDYQFLQPLEPRWETANNIYTVAKRKSDGRIVQLNSSNHGSTWTVTATRTYTENARVLSTYNFDYTAQNDVLVFDQEVEVDPVSGEETVVGYLTEWSVDPTNPVNRRYTGVRDPQHLFTYHDQKWNNAAARNAFLIGKNESSVLYYPGNFTALQNGRQFSYQNIIQYHFDHVKTIIYQNNFYLFGSAGEIASTRIIDGYIESPTLGVGRKYSHATGKIGPTNTTGRLFYQEQDGSTHRIKQIGENNKSPLTDVWSSTTQSFNKLRAYEETSSIGLVAYQDSGAIYSEDVFSNQEGIFIGWLVEDNSQVTVGQVIGRVYYNGVTYDLETSRAGRIEQRIGVGQAIQIGTVIAEIFYQGDINPNAGLYRWTGSGTLARIQISSTNPSINKITDLDAWGDGTNNFVCIMIGEDYSSGESQQIIVKYDLQNNSDWIIPDLEILDDEVFTSITCGDENWILTTSKRILYSLDDGSSFQEAAMPQANYTQSYFKELFVALSDRQVIWSYDGREWNTIDDQEWDWVSHNSGWIFFRGTEEDGIEGSMPGSTFSFERIELESFGGQPIYALDVGEDDKIIAVGAGGIAMYSYLNDIENWELVPTNTSSILCDIAYCPVTNFNRWYIVGFDGTLIYSNNNGEDWINNEDEDFLLTNSLEYRFCYYDVQRTSLWWVDNYSNLYRIKADSTNGWQAPRWQARPREDFAQIGYPLAFNKWTNSYQWLVCQGMNWHMSFPDRQTGLWTNTAGNAVTKDTEVFHDNDVWKALAAITAANNNTFNPALWGVVSTAGTFTRDNSVYDTLFGRRSLTAAAVITQINTNGSNPGPTQATTLAATVGGRIAHRKNSWVSAIRTNLPNNESTLGRVRVMEMHTIGIRPDDLTEEDIPALIDRVESLKLLPEYSFQRGNLNQTNYFLGGTNNGNQSILPFNNFQVRILTAPDGTEILKSIIIGLACAGHSAIDTLVTPFGQYSDRLVVSTTDYEVVDFFADDFGYRIEKTDDYHKLKLKKLADYTLGTNILGDKNLFTEDRLTGTLALHRSFLDWCNEMVIEIPPRMTVIVDQTPNDAFSAVACTNLNSRDESRSTTYILSPYRIPINVSSGDRNGFIRETLSQRNSIFRPFMRQDFDSLDFYFTLESASAAVQYRTTQISTPTAGDRKFNVYGRPTINSELNGSVYYITTETIMGPIGIGTPLESINWIQPSVVMGNNRRSRLFQFGNTIVMSYNLTNYITFGQSIFNIMGSAYFYDGQAIYYFQNTSTFNVSQAQFVVLALGMKFLGSSGQFAFFYSSWDRSIYIFTGSNTLKKFQNLSSFPEVEEGFFSSNEQLLYLKAEDRLLVMRDNVVIATFEINPDSHLIGCVHGCAIQSPTRFENYLPNKDLVDHEPAYIETEWIGLNPADNIIFSGFYVTFINRGPATIKSTMMFQEDNQTTNREQTIRITAQDPVKKPIIFNVNKTGGAAKLILKSDDLISFENFSIILEPRTIRKIPSKGK